MNEVVRFTPGDLVRARGREWVVLPGTSEETLRVRPLSGSESDWLTIDPQLEIEPVESASFPNPDGKRIGPQDEALLMRDAFQLALRRGAGPFRGAGRVAFEPRSYQLVPLMMALKLDPVRMLIADDVGIGKTIEAGLIARELYDRGEIQRCAVLCPPHLVDQWVTQFTTKFHLPAIAVTAGTAARLERDLPTADSIFRAYPFTVVSLDYIKSDRRRHEFIRSCPEFVIVDEAHACVGAGDTTHRRYQLLQELGEAADRHVVLLTATPHSGDVEAFHKLLALLDSEFGGLGDVGGAAYAKLRERLAAHFVQRRRADIEAWKEPGLFPRREEDETTYRLTGEHEAFMDMVLDYCTEVVERVGHDQRKQRLAFWGTLALMRCIGSSPAAALQALRTRLRGDEESLDAASLFDGEGEDLVADDVEPATAEDGDLVALIEMAERLADVPKRDPKLKKLAGRLESLMQDGFSPIIFCRYISTAEWVGEAVRKWFPDYAVEVVTGRLPADERKVRVAAMGAMDRKILVATDCLSEGIDLQEDFDAVVHYDMSWNPTRHQQRNGRVDRFGQPRELVRTLLIYGENNPVDGAILEVILRKAKAIQKDTGVPVPLPDDDRRMTEALLKALLLRRKSERAGRGKQMAFDFSSSPEAERLDAAWRDAAEKEKRNLTIFAQRSLKPEDVLPEWEKTLGVLGNPHQVSRFLEHALRRFDVPFVKDADEYRLDARKLPEALASRLQDAELGDQIRIRRTGGSNHHLHRSHPLVEALAELLIENSLDEKTEAENYAALARTGAWSTAAVKKPTTVILLRIRHRIVTAGAAGETTLLAEETSALAFEGLSAQVSVSGQVASAFVEATAAHETSATAKGREVASVLARLPGWKEAIEDHARARAQELVADHRRVREAVKGTGRIDVFPVTPVDVVGAYSLVPELA
ncbi:DEAD/DEAH box helicase [Bradyrhizobium sp. CIR3A]|uniref:DEAD/DEAH box helicase n=1 Tax=Bradyrhizobium sp. CIR3A TaxID=2663838 RepID=UPI001605F674|nr:DEAD/DEAH box helicase [Bradyrhizobium sp. CIR3A]MBB4263750.1 superfamily II DNA or RNA helicase [Bradyrhizobium sp. CIR3A]